MLQFNALCYQVDNRLLVNDASGHINTHDFIVITGQSGSGKSLLLKLLASLLPLSQGEILFNGKQVIQLTPALWRSKVAYIAQMGEMIEGTVLDNLRLPFTFSFYNHTPFDLNWHRQQLCQFGKTEDFLWQDSRMLSGGEKQLVNLLRTLQLNPAILLLDEPTASLDDTTTHQVETLIQDWYHANSQASVVWVSHEPMQIARLLQCGAIHWRMASGVLTTDNLQPTSQGVL